MSETATRWSRWSIGLSLVAMALLMSLVDVGQAYLRSTVGGPRVEWVSWTLNALPSSLMLAALAPVPIWLSRRWPLDQPPRRTAIAIHIIAALAFAAAHALGMTVWNLIRFSGLVFAAGFSKALSLAIVIDLLVYFGITVAMHAIGYYAVSRERERQAAALQASLADARLAGLRAQINPHVLFNTLNAVSVLALKGDQTGVVRVVELLSDILRSCLDDSRGQEAALADELQLVESYLEIQRIRFADRLTADVHADEEVLAARVPTLVLQPVVENAVTHGISSKREPGRISIRAHRENGSLYLTVADTGPGFGASPHRGRGVGLSNVRARLNQLYGDAQRVSLGAAPHGGASVTIVVPFRE
jgi:signal transduction histidine kinase